MCLHHMDMVHLHLHYLAHLHLRQVLSVHHETSPPYYTIMCDGAEKQTEAERLSPLDEPEQDQAHTAPPPPPSSSSPTPTLT